MESTSTDCDGVQTVTLYPFYDRAQTAGSTWKLSDEGIEMTNTGFATAQIDPVLREYLYSRQTLGIRSVLSRLAGSIRPLAETPASPLHTTGTLYGKTSIAVNEEFPLEINLSTIGAGGPVVDTKVHLNIPAGLEVVTDSAYIEINGMNYRITAENGSDLLDSLAKLNGPSGMKTVTLNLSDLDLPALGGSAGELPGQTNNYLRLKFKPNCNVSTSAMRMEASLSGKRPCGTDLSTATFYSMYITLSGVTASLQVEVAVPTVATNRFNCHQSDTLRVSFRKTGAQTVSVTGTDSLFIIIPRSLHLIGATPIRYALPAGSGTSTVTAQFGTIALGSIVERAYDADTRIISWAMPKEYFDALSDAQGPGFGSTGSVQAEYNQYGICIGMDEPEVYFEGAIQVGVITGASKGGNCSITSGLTNIQTVDVITSAPNTVWTGNTADWNLSSNWTNGLPGACTDAEIPASSTVFPVLSDTTIRVNSVYLPSGAEIGGIPYLNYDSARVDLSITSNRWYLLSSPFMDMYSGDYILGSTRNNPAVYIRRYQSEDLFSGAAKKVASWTSSFGQTNILLTPGTGYAIWVATDENESRTFDFPKDAMSYDVYNKGGTSVAYTEEIPSRINSYRFAFYDKFNQNAGKNNRSFDLAVENGDNTSYTNLLIANPFMSHLDFDAFYSENSGKIGNAFYVWNGNSFTATNQAYNEASGDYDSRYIAPQQSFVVLRNGAADVSTLRFTPAMSVANVGSSLRNAGAAHSSSPRLQLKVYRYGVLQSEAEIRYQPGASNGFEDTSDAWTLFAEDVKKTAVLYSLVDNAAASINTIGSLNEDIPLGIRTSEPGELKFEITGAESFDGDVYLIDVARGGQAIELGTSTEYAFNNTTGDIIDRFYIRILGTGTGINDETTAHGILIYQENSVLYVKSDL
ncbi:MAG: hypothetical protein LBM08_08060, partial [Dysgonamonadaceae bacterium]|nr:hypothetical protein [Dysgonamonadaceae bacterium]